MKIKKTFVAGLLRLSRWCLAIDTKVCKKLNQVYSSL